MKRTGWLLLLGLAAGSCTRKNADFEKSTVDTLTAQHLLKTVTAARLMGADCMISGIRPQIAQTIVYLGIDLTDVTTKATLADAFLTALKRLGATITRSQPK